MRLSSMTLLCSLSAIISACGGPSEISLVGKTAAEQTQSIVKAVCDYAVECGNYSMDCAGTSDGSSECTASFETVTYDECSADMNQELQVQTICWNELGDADFFALVESCINALTAPACVTDDEIQAYVDALNTGEDPGSIRPEPEVCKRFQSHEVVQTCDRLE